MRHWLESHNPRNNRGLLWCSWESGQVKIMMIVIVIILILIPGMIRTATILVSCPTWTQQDTATPAQHSPQMEKRFYQHIWLTLSSKIEKVPMLFNYLLFFKQGLLVAGGLGSGVFLSSTEIYLPSNNKWTAVKNLPRFHFAKAPLYFIKNCF